MRNIGETKQQFETVSGWGGATDPVHSLRGVESGSRAGRLRGAEMGPRGGTMSGAVRLRVAVPRAPLPG